MAKAKKGKRTGKSSARTIAMSARVTRAIEMRLEGKTMAEIAKELGWNSRHAAYMAITRAVESTQREPVEALREYELARLEKMWEVPYLNAQGGDTFAIAACLRIMERRSRLLGLDAPVKSEAKVEAQVAGGVLVVPAPMNDADWREACARSQAELIEKEKSVRVIDGG
jgi:hypothetical protein